jgi:hypothetical protein
MPWPVMTKSNKVRTSSLATRSSDQNPGTQTRKLASATAAAIHNLIFIATGLLINDSAAGASMALAIPTTVIGRGRRICARTPWGGQALQ